MASPRTPAGTDGSGVRLTFARRVRAPGRQGAPRTPDRSDRGRGAIARGCADATGLAPRGEGSSPASTRPGPEQVKVDRIGDRLMAGRLASHRLGRARFGDTRVDEHRGGDRTDHQDARAPCRGEREPVDESRREVGSGGLGGDVVRGTGRGDGVQRAAPIDPPAICEVVVSAEAMPASWGSTREVAVLIAGTKTHPSPMPSSTSPGSTLTK